MTDNKQEDEEDVVFSYNTKIKYERCVLCNGVVYYSLLGWLHLNPLHDLGHHAKVKEDNDQ